MICGILIEIMIYSKRTQLKHI